MFEIYVAIGARVRIDIKYRGCAIKGVLLIKHLSNLINKAKFGASIRKESAAYLMIYAVRSAVKYCSLGFYYVHVVVNNYL